jgi:hypothetical protein
MSQSRRTTVSPKDQDDDGQDGEQAETLPVSLQLDGFYWCQGISRRPILDHHDWSPALSRY